MNDHSEYTANRLRFELKPQQTQKLKDIACFYGNNNLAHQLNLLISSLHTALGLDKKEDK